MSSCSEYRINYIPLYNFMSGFFSEEEEPERDVPPEFRSLIRDTNAVEGEPATFDCQVSGRPKPTVKWQKVCWNVFKQSKPGFLEHVICCGNIIKEQNIITHTFIQSCCYDFIMKF